MLANKAQEEAIHTISGQMLLIACPGSGKTTTLIRRIHHMIVNEGIDPGSILMITFTKSAADEMGKKYQAMYQTNPGVTFATIHSLCFAIVKKFYEKPVDLITESEVFRYFSYKVKYMDEINDEDQFISDLILDISLLKNNMIPLENFTPSCIEKKKIFQKLYTEYEDMKTKEDKVDFDDMLVLAKKILETNSDAYQWIRNKYRYIQVDEYQDTNIIQRDIIYLIAGKNGNLAVVGDDDQSIYMFRGAKPDIMLNFPKDFPNAKIIRMSTNYRSLQGIISKADKLVKHNKKRFEKQFTGARKEEGSIFYRNYLNPVSQLMAVVQRIQTLIKDGVDPNQIAVLYRTNQESLPFIEAFLKKNIPFQCNEKVKSKYDHWIFYDIQAYQKVAKGKGTSADFCHILNHPNRFFYGKEFQNLPPEKDALIKAIYKQKKEFWKINSALKSADNLFRHLTIMKDMPPESFLKAMFLLVNYKDYISSYAKSRNADEKELLDIWNSYMNDAIQYKTWEAWGKHIVSYNRLIRSVSKKKDGVMLSTMHRSKGLEWNYVFIVNCMEDTIPYKKSKKSDEIEEERRLFYVAMTRAKDCLFLSSYKGKPVSRFIKECGLEK